MGKTDLVEHKISLQPYAISKQKRPYRLPPGKREVLRQFEDLSPQGIVTVVDEGKDLPSVVVLVTKINKPQACLKTREA